MRWIDRGLSVLLILAGFGHTFGVLHFYKNPDTLFWSLTDSVLVFLLATINLLRSARPFDRGLAVIATCSTVNFALRTPGEQEALVAGFGRYLHSLTAPVQILVRTERLDLSGQIAECIECTRNRRADALEPDTAVEEKRDGRLIGRVEHCRRRATPPPRRDAEGEGRKLL